MQFDEIHIDGYGIFHNVDLTQLPPSLVVFVGANESGKSTLLEYIRHIVFGPSSKRNSNKYGPLRGGTHGGKIGGQLRSGERVTLSRLDKTATVARGDGMAEPIEPAESLFDGLQRSTFEQVFAVDLASMQNFRVLEHEDVRSRLAGAGTGLGATTLPRAMMELDERIDAILKHRGRTQEINRLDAKLDETEARIRELRSQADEYQAYQKERSALKEQLANTRGAIAALEERQSRFRLLQRARKPWVRWEAARKLRRENEFAREFPASGRQQFERLVGDIDQTEAHLEENEQRAGQVKARLEQTVVDQRVLDAEGDIEALCRHIEKFNSALHDLPQLINEREQQQRHLDRRLDELRDGFEEDHLHQADTSVGRKREAVEFAQQLDAARQRVSALAIQQEAADEAVAQTEAALEEARQKFEQAPPPRQSDAALNDPNLFSSQRQAARRLRAQLYQGDQARAELERIEAEIHTHRSTARELAGQSDELQVLAWWWQMAAGVGGTMLAGMFLFLHWWGGAVALILATAAACAMLWLFRTQQQRSRQQRLTDHERAVGRNREQLQRAEEERSRRQRSIEDCSTAIQQIAAEAGLRVPDSLADLEELAAEVEAEAAAYEAWTAKRQQQEVARTEHRQAALNRAALAEKQMAVQADIDRLTRLWSDWLARHGYPAQVVPHDVAHAAAAIEAVRNARQALSETDRRIGQVESFLQMVRGQIAKAYERIGQQLAAQEMPSTEEADEPANDDIPRTESSGQPEGDNIGVPHIEKLEKILQGVMDQAHRRRQLELQLEDKKDERRRLESALVVKRQRLDRLFQAAGAKNEHEFISAADAHDQWQQQARDVQECELQLTEIAGTAAAKVALIDDLKKTDAATVERELDSAQRELREKQQLLEETRERIGRVSSEIDRMAQDTKLGKLLLERQMLRAHKSDAVRRWAELALCRGLIERARDYYESQRQPRVFQEANELLAAMTGDRYRLLCTPGDAEVKLEELRRRDRKTEEMWSSGLADQTYLAIRLGLVREFARHMEPLPVILDDVLVRFDDRRRCAAVRMLMEFSRSHQVLLFSCHEDLAPLVASVHQEPALRDVPVACIQLEDGKMKKRPLEDAPEPTPKSRPATASPAAISEPTLFDVDKA